MATEVESSAMAKAAATTTTAPLSSANNNNNKRKLNHGKGKKKKPNKKQKPVARPRNPSQKMKKLFKKRAKAYNSDDDDEEEEEEKSADEQTSEEEEEENDGERDLDDDGGGKYQRDSGITKFSEGCRAFRTAFLKIMNKHLPNDPLGPILSAHKKLVAEKLLEEETEHKAKGQAKKEKHLAGEKGHIIPDSVLDTKERLLISIATKGVVKLFNAVNKAQNPQKDLNPSRSKDAKELAKRRKQTFLSELKKSATESQPFNSSKLSIRGIQFQDTVNKSVNDENDDEPGWAPLRDSYMLTSSKLKDWDKMPDPTAVVDHGTVPLESSSDED